MIDIKNIRKHIYSVILPFITVWFTILYIRLMNHLTHKELIVLRDIYGRSAAAILFIPVIFLDGIFSSIFRGDKKIRLWPEDMKSRIFLVLRIIAWSVLYYFWVIRYPGSPAKNKWLEFFNFSFYPMTGMIYIAESYLTAFSLIIWLALYYILTVRKRVLRIFTSFILPGMLTVGLFYHFYFMGGVGHRRSSTIAGQKGVEIFYAGDYFPKTDYFHHKTWTEKYKLFPREVVVDTEQNALYACYANTYGKLSAKKTPNILRIELDTRETGYFRGYYTRAFSAEGKGVILSPWFENKVYELNKENLSVIREFPARTGIDTWEVIDILFDGKTDCIYIANDMEPAIVKYNYKDGEMLGSFIPQNAKYGGCLWCMKKSRKTGMIYCAGFGVEYDVLEIDPETMEMKRGLDLVGYGGSALGLDDRAGLLYFQDGGTSRIFEIDIEKFDVKRILDSEVHAREIIIDKARNCLYVLGFFHGNLLTIDLNSGKRLWTLKVGGKPAGLAIHNNVAYVNSTAGIIKIDLNTVWREYRRNY